MCGCAASKASTTELSLECLAHNHNSPAAPIASPHSTRAQPGTITLSPSNSAFEQQKNKPLLPKSGFRDPCLCMQALERGHRGRGAHLLGRRHGAKHGERLAGPCHPVCKDRGIVSHHAALHNGQPNHCIASKESAPSGRCRFG